MKFIVRNIVEGKKIFSGNEKEFIHFVRKVAVENEDEDMSITCLQEATEYINVYCDNLRYYIPSPTKLIGYQIVSKDGKNELPSCFESFEVIEDITVAEKWLIMEKKNPEHGKFRWVIEPVFEETIDEPTFIDTI